MKLLLEAGDVADTCEDGDPRWLLVLKQIPPLHSLPLSLVTSVSLLALHTLGDVSFFLTLGEAFFILCFCFKSLSDFVSLLGVELLDLGVMLHDFSLSFGGENSSWASCFSRLFKRRSYTVLESYNVN